MAFEPGFLVRLHCMRTVHMHSCSDAVIWNDLCMTDLLMFRKCVYVAMDTLCYTISLSLARCFEGSRSKASSLPLCLAFEKHVKM